MSLETITYENLRREEKSRFLEFEVYPESDLATLAEIAEATERIFEIVALRNDNEHAEHTWRIWLSALKANRSAAIALVGKEIFDRYEKYLKFCIIDSHVANTAQVRIALKRIDNPRP